MERRVRVRATLLPLLVASFGCGDTAGGGEASSEADVDGDGYLAPDDCDDQNSRVSPDATERCNRQDDDCDGEVDESADACPGDFTTEGGNEMIVVWPGHFVMGAAPAGRNGSYTDHPVALTHAYWLGEHEVLQSEWEKAGFGNPSGFPGRTQPVEKVSWEYATAYANWVSAAEGLEPCYEPDGEALADTFFEDAYACPGYRFPTEAEWEYAARAGKDLTYSGSDVAEEVAWVSTNADGTTHERCDRAKNAWGFCDLSGNVDEWTGDEYDESFGGYGDGGFDEDPMGPSTAVHGEMLDRVVRGGGWGQPSSYAEVAHRLDGGQGIQVNMIGLRLARTVPE